MLPLDNDFLTVYFLNLLPFSFFLFKYLKKNKNVYLINFLINVTYIAFNIYEMSDPGNFKYGGSLPMLFYTALPPLVHMIVYTMAYLTKKLYLALIKPKLNS